MTGCLLLALGMGLYYAVAIYGLMRDRYEDRRLSACGLDYYMPKHLLQKQLYALHGEPSHD